MVGRGYHIALDRENAKRVFAQKDDENLRRLLDELKSSPEVKKSGRLLDLGTTWDPIHRCLTEGELDPTGGDFPLNTAILGGKKLHQGDDYAAMLIRPDMNIFIAEALGEVDEMEFRAKFFALNTESFKGPITDKAFVEIWLNLQKLKVFFEESAENLEAVIFTASYQG
ncbi:Domain of unknown function DUF1877 [Pirellula staleyi DSM 6068]|uniref:Uncharacterized protein n=1 Tax=Pirellula staleyi (strain ATCC 27377 / DSM 6068 / ICPB 4128) TaxID=530564 RepID=D2R5R9_PIRSD|nr:DUF1877 family protein [Pirellula staleyi]ADB17251.1 Domain of unknown function DUF1877 [Pirellula staleyi DSM 6068]